VVTAIIPSDWKHGEVTPLPKPKNLENPSSWRPVWLTEVVAKLTERVVAERLLEEVTLHQMQFGFKRSRTTTDALFQQLDEIVDVKV
jgi:hypothetical protein